MRIIGQVVTHRAFGVGVVNAQHGDYITVHFTCGHKDFLYPGAFSRYLAFSDPRLQEEILKALEQHTSPPASEEGNEKGFLSLCANKVESDCEHASPSSLRSKLRRRNRRTADPDAGNLAFKCTYCDGGQNNERMGFCGLCSPELISFNLKKEKLNRCRLQENYCPAFYEGRISYRQLQEAWESGQMSCESTLLQNWIINTGFHAEENTVVSESRFRTQVGGKLGILTTRTPHTKESERVIFGVFLIDENSDTQDNFATLSAHPSYRLFFSQKEAKQLLYWNYHQNLNAAEKAAWGTGIYRYLPNHEALSILWDAVCLKRGSAEATLATEFLDYYCEQNDLDPLDIPEPSGALTL